MINSVNVTKPKEAVKMNDQTDGTRRGGGRLFVTLQGVWEQLTSTELALQKIRALSITLWWLLLAEETKPGFILKTANYLISHTNRNYLICT